MVKLKEFIKNEIVLIISFLLSVVSMLFVTPSKEYIHYIDFKTITLLLSLMAVMAGLQSLGIFRLMAERLLLKVDNSRQLYLTLVLMCCFSSMIITNDVSLITFVPFTIITLKMAGQEKRLVFIVVMETIAANLGSMLTPIGNPQNLYLFSAYNMTIADFVKTILPYSVLSLVLLVLCSLFIKNDKVSLNSKQEQKHIDKKLLALYSLLFILAILSVFRVLNYIVLLAIVLAAMLIFDRKIFAKIDYSLLFTFVFLFIFIGNLGNIDAVSDFLKRIVNGNEVLVGIGASQIFSNVPSAILLSGFTDNANALLIGVNLGGLGTLIASMASLISYKFIQKDGVKTAKYMLVFTLFNMLFLALNLALWLIIK